MKKVNKFIYVNMMEYYVILYVLTFVDFYRKQTNYAAIYIIF